MLTSKSKDCATLQKEQDASNSDTENAAAPDQMSQSTSTTPNIHPARLPVVYMPDATVVKEGLVHFASHYSLRNKLREYWGVLRVLDGTESGAVSPRRTFELYRLSHRFNAAEGPASRSPEYMYTFTGTAVRLR